MNHSAQRSARPAHVAPTALAACLTLTLALAVAASASAQSEPAPSAPPTPPATEAAPAPSPPASAPSAQPEAEAEPAAPASAAAPEPPPVQPAPRPEPAAQAEVPEPAPDEGDAILVLGTQLSRSAGAAYVLGERQLQRFQYDDPHAALQQIPGVYVRQEDGIGLRPNIGLRGVNPDRSKKVTLMEDGVLFGPAPYSAPAAYYFPVLTRMTQIRVIEGPAAIAHGPQTVGGAIDFVTRDIPAATAAMIDLAGGQFGYQKAHGYFGASEGNFGFLVEGLRLHNTGFKKLPGDADTGSTRNEWMVKSSYQLEHGRTHHEFRLKLTYSEERSNETYLGLSDADFRQDPDRRYPASTLDQMNNHRTSLVFSHALAFEQSPFTLTTTAYRHDYARIWRKINKLRGSEIFTVLRDPGMYAESYAVLNGTADTQTGDDALLIGPNDRTFVNQGVQSVLRTQFTTAAFEHRLEAGLRLHYDSIYRHHSQSAYLMTGGELIPEGTGVEVTAVNEARTYALAAHVVDAISWRALIVTLGLRLELIASELEDIAAGGEQDARSAAILPGAGLYYALSDALGLLAGVYRGFSPPAPGVDEFEPEYSVNYEAGARLKHGGLRAEVLGFFNHYSNLTDTCTRSSSCDDEGLGSQVDAGEAQIYGLQAHLQHEVPFGKLGVPFGASYTYTHAEFRQDFDSADPIYGKVERGFELPYVPPHQLSARLGLEAPLFAINTAVNYVAAMREVAGRGSLRNTLATDTQFTIDVGGKLRLGQHFELYVNLRNLLDTRDIVSRRPYGARPNAPRWFQAGLRAEL